ncbi:hypothetical protein [Actinopolyspora halophila]|uniref:pPIWI_RE_Z domain-containing protein n=1 Tax=Actinopolyspora halophila TaxID=1850 RepID=UPI00039E0632|nr:hypothetical protein [Actinopolyspora halophila]
MARDRNAWRRQLDRTLQQAAKQDGLDGAAITRMQRVELGLFALKTVAPREAAADGWALLFGYDFRLPHSRNEPFPKSLPWLLHDLKNEHDWLQALRAYQHLPERLRLFHIDDVQHPAVRRTALSVAPDREAVYAQALAALPEHTPHEISQAEPNARYRLRRGDRTVTFPRELVSTSTRRHQRQRTRRRLRLRWSALETTATAMDSIDAEHGLQHNWRGRIDDLRLFVCRSGALKPARSVALEDVVHMVGMPAVGKTTLLTVAAVWAARRGHQLTLVLGDVVSVLTMVRDLRRYRARAAPILGASNRGRHLQQLHRHQDGSPSGLALLDDDRARWVSTACAVHGLLDPSQPWSLADVSCSTMYRWTDEDTEQTPPRCCCPLLDVCGWHYASRELVEAPIWVTTAPSLLHCRVPPQLSDTTMRYLELAWSRSDAFLIDEADRVQVQWDQAFSPSQVLSGPGEQAWLDGIRPVFHEHMRRTQRRHLTNSSVRNWLAELNAATSLVDSLWALMSTHSYVRTWLSGGYFNEWLLGLDLAHHLASHAAGSAVSSSDTGDNSPFEVWRKQWQGIFATWIHQPLGEHADDVRVAMLQQIAARGYDSLDAVTRQLREWLRSLPEMASSEESELDRLAVRLHVTIVTALLADKLNVLIHGCWEVAAETDLETLSSSDLVHRPPAEYLPVVPDSPMGNLLGFQYHEHQESPSDQLGTLSFFRCSGIGRWLLLNLPGLYGPSDDGPAALFLSATSWCGNSPRYDVQVPVSAVVTSALSEQVPVDTRITMRYRPTTTIDSQGRSSDVRVSGKHGEERQDALRQILQDLSRSHRGLHGPQPSTLEQVRDDLHPQRQRLLLLVGSYQEADDALRELLKIRPDWEGQILQMVPDDDTGTHTWSPYTLARSAVHTLARHDTVWLLIAPQLAIERGHNILNEDYVAALGAAFYLVRPHLHPDDLSYHVQRMYRWAVNETDAGLSCVSADTESLGDRARAFARIGHRYWKDNLEQSLRYANTEHDSADRRAMDWTNIAPLNQVVGRMLRGGSDAQVYFCDGAFDPRSRDSPLMGMYRALDEELHGPNAELAAKLYQPLHYALHRLLENYRGEL